ncbi:DUF3846 domain-containing protein [Actinomadura nitritigenes]|uniref:DUF3846 domain-containing protein n=1 Tax=Actinomadura nitritigenes TaxID=134602 RepID=UPI003D8D34E6
MDRTALVLTPWGQLSQIEIPSPAADPHGKTIRAAIGCTYFEVVRLTDALDMWVDEEGAYSKVVNGYATSLAQRYGHLRQPFWGTALFATSDHEGNTLGLLPDQATALRSQIISLPVFPPVSATT